MSVQFNPYHSSDTHLAASAQFDLNAQYTPWRTQGETVTLLDVDEGRKRVIGIMAAILASLHMQTADDLFGTSQGSPRTDRLIDASIQWAEWIMRKIDNVFSG